jgi:hypothetical protein
MAVNHGMAMPVMTVAEEHGASAGNYAILQAFQAQPDRALLATANHRRLARLEEVLTKLLQDLTKHACLLGYGAGQVC